MSAHLSTAPVGGKLINKTTVVCGVLIVLMLAVLATRFVLGLGAVTNLNDGYAWGLWVVVDVLIGSASGATGTSGTSCGLATGT